MKKILSFFFWLLIFAGVLGAADQALVRIEADLPGYREVRNFYLDFRERLLGLYSGDGPASIEEVIEKSEPQAPLAPQPGGFVYVDDRGVLHLVESLEDVPPAYRREAKKLSR